jgi:hypothetical protein
MHDWEVESRIRIWVIKSHEVQILADVRHVIQVGLHAKQIKGV